MTLVEINNIHGYLNEQGTTFLNLELINKDGQIIVSSRQIAEKFGKEHKNVLRDIENILRGLLKIEQAPMFFESSYIHPQNKQKYPEYLMNRDGFSLLTMGFTGADALEWKIRQITRHSLAKFFFN